MCIDTAMSYITMRIQSLLVAWRGNESDTSETWKTGGFRGNEYFTTIKQQQQQQLETLRELVFLPNRLRSMQEINLKYLRSHSSYFTGIS